MPPLPPASFRGSPTVVRIACFNTEALAVPGESSRFARERFDPGRQRHLDRVAAVIEVVDPDILILSEIASAEPVAALAAILKDKGLGTFQVHHVDGQDRFTGFDVAVLARLPADLIDGTTVRLFAPQKAPRRSAVLAGEAELPWTAERYVEPQDDGSSREEIAVLKRHAVCCFTVAGRRLGLVGLHLKSNPSDPGANAQRAAEVEIVRRIVCRELMPGGYLPIVLGDLNDYDPDVPMADRKRTTQTAVLRNLRDIDPSRPGEELVNAAAAIPRIADRYSSHWDYNENGAADPEDVFTLIDHILLDRRLADGLRRAFICHASCLDASDHFPVVVDIDLAVVPPARP
jgi:endonuclease/exonuclease/phosphatase family metal-dependent hydrolase